jgi:hypothetical protein
VRLERGRFALRLVSHGKNRRRVSIVPRVIDFTIVAILSLAPYQVALGATPSAEEQSCRMFVKGFYDWYWNRESHRAKDLSLHGHDVDEVMGSNSAALSEEFIRFIKKDEKELPSANEAGNLDFDPFLKSQDPLGKYLVGNVVVTNCGCKASIHRAHVVAELKQAGPNWIFVNFRYSSSSADGRTKDLADDDMIHMFNPK